MRDTSHWADVFTPFEPASLPIEHVEDCVPAPAATGPAQEIALRYGMASLEHWLDLSA